MILSSAEIQTAMGDTIEITPYEKANLNPNSYNLSLHNELLVYEEVILDVKYPNRFHRVTIPDDGLILNPNQIYLGRTVEHTKTDGFAPMIAGRSSLARLGLSVHTGCGFGNVGFCGYWTLEMVCVQPLRIYPYIPICQIYYLQIAGDIEQYRSDKYQHNHDVQPSLFYREFTGQDPHTQYAEFYQSQQPYLFPELRR